MYQVISWELERYQKAIEQAPLNGEYQALLQASRWGSGLGLGLGLGFCLNVASP